MMYLILGSQKGMTVRGVPTCSLPPLCQKPSTSLPKDGLEHYLLDP